MKFVATLTHPPEHCLARDGYRKEYDSWVGNLEKSAKKLGVKIDGAFVSPNEHTFYFVLESDSMDGVTQLLGPPILTHNSGRISAVITLDGGSNLLKKFTEEGR